MNWKKCNDAFEDDVKENVWEDDFDNIEMMRVGLKNDNVIWIMILLRKYES